MHMYVLIGWYVLLSMHNALGAPHHKYVFRGSAHMFHMCSNMRMILRVILSWLSGDRESLTFIDGEL
jgi:hypothetical protein